MWSHLSLPSTTLIAHAREAMFSQIAAHIIIRVFPGSHFGSFYPQNLALNPKKLGARILNDASIINLKFILSIFGFIF